MSASSERLLGKDHTRIGECALVGRNRAAIALSRGGAPKRYAYTDPNEDAVGLADGAGGWLLAVADGHYGAPCAAIATATLLDDLGPRLLGEAPPAANDGEWEDLAYEALQAANRAVIAAGAESPTPVGDTTLSFALVRPKEARLVHGSVGDSHVFVIGPGGPADVGWQSLGLERCHFLGFPEEPEHRANSALGWLPLTGVQALVLATDGLSERGIGVASPSGVIGEQWDAALKAETEADPRAVRLCRGVAEAAQEAQRENSAGDNIAVAALIL